MSLFVIRFRRYVWVSLWAFWLLTRLINYSRYALRQKRDHEWEGGETGALSRTSDVSKLNLLICERRERFQNNQRSRRWGLRRYRSMSCIFSVLFVCVSPCYVVCICVLFSTTKKISIHLTTHQRRANVCRMMCSNIGTKDLYITIKTS